MAHDFAKRRSGNKASGKRPAKRSATKVNPRPSNWPWFFSGLLSGILVTAVVFLGVANPASLRQSLNVPEIAPAGDSDAGETNGDNDFQFYEYLPEAEVRVDVVPVEVAPQQEENPADYLLQAGSFQNRRDAENRLAEIMLLDLSASIVPAVVAGNTWHRVRVGPITGRANVEDAREKLFANNIDTIVLRMRQE